jgi:hypothetical protein
LICCSTVLMRTNSARPAFLLTSVVPPVTKSPPARPYLSNIHLLNTANIGILVHKPQHLLCGQTVCSQIVCDHLCSGALWQRLWIYCPVPSLEDWLVCTGIQLIFTFKRTYYCLIHLLLIKNYLLLAESQSFQLNIGSFIHLVKKKKKKNPK